MKNRRHQFAALVFCVALVLNGCSTRTNVVNAPAGVTQDQINTWIHANQNLDTATSATLAIERTTVSLHTQKVIPDSPAYLKALECIGRAAQVEIEAAQFLQTVPNTWTQPIGTKVASFTKQIIDQLTQAIATGVLNVSDPGTGTAISQLVTNVITIIQQIQQAATTVTTAAPSPGGLD